jgi:CPA2 family monovalent cation:H+ antiporter-2
VSEGSDQQQYVVIAGYGLPGRAVAESLDARGVPYCVIELNEQTVSRCLRGGVRIIEGNVADPRTLDRAEIGRATLFVVAVPDEEVAVRAVAAARRLNPTMRIVARCQYLSAGMRATAAGADEVIIAEKVVADEMARAAGAI